MTRNDRIAIVPGDGIGIVEHADKAGIRFMVYENWRFQPSCRQIKRLLNDGAIGEKIHVMVFRSRMGDGWGRDAYLNRQPYFRDYPRLLVYENGVHFIDTYRYLAGEIERVYAVLKKLNPVISGDCCYFAQRHFIDRLIDGKPFETNGTEYLRTLAVQDAVYESAEQGTPVYVRYL